MTIQAIFFDIGGTLERVRVAPDQRQKIMPEFNKLLLSFGINLNLNDKELFSVINDGYKRYHDWSVYSMVELSPKRVWSEYILKDYVVDRIILDVAAETLMAFLEENFYAREFRIEVPSVLEAIQEKNLKIGLISNICCRGLVPSNLRKYGIINFFNPIVLSSEFGRRKPDPEIFLYATQLANVLPANCIYVGDRIARDIVGASKAGFAYAVQIINEFDHGEDDSGATPDAIIYHMSELLDFLKTVS